MIRPSLFYFITILTFFKRQKREVVYADQPNKIIIINILLSEILKYKSDGVPLEWRNGTTAYALP